MPGLWADIDCYKLSVAKDETIAALRSCPLPPTVIVDSGGGLHPYWLFLEPLDVRFAPAVGKRDTIKEDVDGALKQLAGVFAGDTASCDITRILRLVGTHNSKTGELRPVTMIEASGKRYDLGDLQDMLDTQRPLIARPDEPTANQPTDPYAEYAHRYGFKAPVDVEARLGAMAYMADGDNGIHQTQLSVSASLVAQGDASDEDIVAALLIATQAASGPQGLNWNWKREEAAIVRMVATARAKFGQPAPRPKLPNSNPSTHTDVLGQVVDFAEQRQSRTQQKPRTAPDDDDPPLIARIGQATIDFWQKNHGALISTGAGMASYVAAQGGWVHFDDDVELRLRVAIQGVMAAAKVKPQTATLNAVLRYIKEHPSLHREGVAWDTSGLIVCRNGALNPVDNSLAAHSPEHYATWRIDCDYDPKAACPRFVAFLAHALEGVPSEEVTQIVATLGEHMGAALVKAKHRNLRKALYLLGKSRSGKTRLANIYRALFGGPGRCTAIKLEALSDIFGAAPLLKAAAWIADDVVKQGGGRYAEAINAEQLKNIITGEPMAIRVPGGHYVEASLDLPVVWTGNNLPAIRDDSDAVYNRLIVFPLNHEWPEDAVNPDPRGREIDEVLVEEELAGILNFALYGYARLKVRGRYDLPPSMVAAISELRETNQPLIRWLQECTATATDVQVDNRDIMGSVRGWWLQQYDDDRIPGGKAVMHALKRCYPTMRATKSNGWRISAGIELTHDGIACLKHAQATAPMGKAIGSGCDPFEANRAGVKF